MLRRAVRATGRASSRCASPVEMVTDCRKWIALAGNLRCLLWPAGSPDRAGDDAHDGQCSRSLRRGASSWRAVVGRRRSPGSRRPLTNPELSLTLLSKSEQNIKKR